MNLDEQVSTRDLASHASTSYSDDGTVRHVQLRSATGDYMDATDHATFDPGTGDFTFVMLTTPVVDQSGTRILAAKRAGTGVGWNLFTNAGVLSATVDVAADATGSVVATGGSLTLNTRAVVAVVRSSGSHRVVLNGTGGTPQSNPGSIDNTEDLRINRGSGSTTAYANQNFHGAAWFKGTALTNEQIVQVGAELLAAALLGGGISDPDRFTTPFHGGHVEEAAGPYYTSIWSTTDYIFVAAPLTIDGVEQSRVARLSKSAVAQQNVQLRSKAHDAQVGHRGASVGTRSDGIVHTFGHGHNDGWTGKHSSAAYDLTTLGSTTTPSGAAGSAGDSYRRLFRDPFTNDMWAVIRGDGQFGRVYRWQAGAWALKVSIDDAGYGQEMAFASGAVYVTVDVREAGAGFPRSDTGLIRSTDNGATWTNLAGAAVADPTNVTTADCTVAFPTPGADNVANGQVTVLSDGTILMTAEYQDVGDSALQVYEAVWNGSSFVRTRLSNHAAGVGFISMSNQNGLVCVTAKTGDNSVGGLLYLYVRASNGSWVETLLDPGQWLGAYHDPYGHNDGVLRLLPMSKDAPSSHQVWELDLVSITPP